MSVVVFLASLANLAAQYGSCFPIVFRLGKFFARSTTRTSVPISGPSTLISEKIPAVCALFNGLLLTFEAIVEFAVRRRQQPDPSVSWLLCLQSG